MANKPIKIYEDKALTKEIENGNIFNFGIVKAGDSKTFEYWIYNISEAFLKDLEFTVGNPEVEIIEAPTELLPGIKGRLLLEWKPSINLKQGLKAPLKVFGTEEWRP